MGKARHYTYVLIDTGLFIDFCNEVRCVEAAIYLLWMNFNRTTAVPAGCSITERGVRDGRHSGNKMLPVTKEFISIERLCIEGLAFVFILWFFALQHKTIRVSVYK